MGGVNPQAGIIVAVVLTLWIAYLVPHRLRTRQEMLDARTQDRFSADLRVIRRARTPVPEVAHTVSATPLLARPRAPLPVVVEVNMDRTAIETARRTAAERSQRAAVLARRAAATRRRRILVASLVLIAGGLWTAFAMVTAFPMWPAIIPTVLAVLLVAAGIASGRAARAADAAYEERRNRPAAPTTRVVAQMIEPAAPVAGGQRATGHAHKPSEQVTEFLFERPAERSVETSGEGIPILHPAESEVPAERRPTVWVPKPVPAPAYTLKPKVQRPAAPELEFGPDGRLADPAVDTTAQTVADVLSEPDVITTGSMNLDDILARRRAAGL